MILWEVKLIGLVKRMYYNEKHKNIVEKRGDRYKYLGSYKTKEVTLDGKNKNGKKNYFRVKCPYCGGEYDVRIDHFVDGGQCINCCHTYENSLAHYIQVELKRGLNEFWDWNNNELNPYHIYKNSTKKVKIKCIEKDYHGNYSIDPHHFIRGNRCSYCGNHKVHPKDSFGQWLIDTYGDDAIEKYWSNKNIVNPFSIATQSNKKVWMLCQNKKYHNDNGGYEISPGNFYYGYRCPYCGKHKVHLKDSFGYLYPDKARYWSKNNKKSALEMYPKSSTKKYKFICEKCGQEFEKYLSDLNETNNGVICQNCNASQLEQSTKEILDKYKIKYYREYMYNDLMGIGNKNLRFDFYLPDYDTLIECQGIQHEEWQRTWMAKYKFEKQLEHDKRKKDYCKKNGIKLIEIWYNEIENIEEILKKELSLV